MRKFEAKIEMRDPYEIYVDAEGIITKYGTAKTLEEAKKIAEQLEKEAYKEWKKRNSERVLREKRLEEMEHNLDNYIDYLKKELWHCRKWQGMTEGEKKLVEEKRKLLKEIISVLEGIYVGAKKVVWHQSYWDGRTYYTIENVKNKKEDDK